MVTLQDQFRELLLDISNGYSGRSTDLKILKFLLSDYLPRFPPAIEKNITALDMFTELHNHGHISYDDVNILKEIAQLKKNKLAVYRIFEYLDSRTQNYPMRTPKKLSLYRKAMFNALQVEPAVDLKRVCTFYRLNLSAFRDIWDVVLHLEIERRVVDSYKEVQRFAKTLNNSTAHYILIGYSHTIYETPISPGCVHCQRCETICCYKFSSKSTDACESIEHAQKAKEMDKLEFNKTLIKLSQWYQENNCLNMLKLLFSDHITGVESLGKIMDLFKALKTFGHLSCNNIRILIDMIKVTNMKGVLNSKKILQDQYDDTPVTCFKPYRKMLIILGNALSDTDCETLGDLYDIPQNAYNFDKWILIMELERKGKIDDMNLLIENLKSVEIPFAAKHLEEALKNEQPT